MYSPAAPAVVGRPELLDGVGRVRPGRERVSVEADFGIDVEVVEQHELPRERVCVGRDVFAEDRERRIAVAQLDVAEDLVVRAVLADDVEDVLDRRRRADALRDRRDSGRACGREPLRLGVGGDFEHLLRVRREGRGVGQVDDRERALEQLARVLPVGGGRRRLRTARVRLPGQALAVEDEQPPAFAVEQHRRRVPARRDEALHLALAGFCDVDQRHRVVVGVGDGQRRAIGRHVEGVRRRPRRCIGIQGHRNLLTRSPGPASRLPTPCWCWRTRRRAASHRPTTPSHWDVRRPRPRP